ncbi:peptide/nickel transport system permease protein [Deinobacterium chartae]|uniref:Peptide/nickel transport system permease protein n=1 Tax=Deinobacterium chartae TaxID=521158 RepID=A0A841I169_9DEIO|nr:peptide/nickel transport system permease protein [Deinobacterium chartae]
MFNFIVRRLLQLPLVLFGVSILIFALTQLLSPEVRAVAYIRNEKQINQLPEIVRQYGLDKDIFTQYGIWLSNVLQGNLGWSTAARRPVAEALAAALPATIELAVAALIPIVLFGVFFGVWAGVNRNKWQDQVSRVFSIFFYSLPSFVVGITLLAVFYGNLQWFEPGRINTILSLTQGLPSVDGFLVTRALFTGNWELLTDLLKHLVLPVATLTIVSSAGLMRVVRSNVVDQINQDYVRTARAKGLAPRTVTYKHALRNALIPVVTMVGTILYGLLGGVAITETVFNYPGIGAFAAQAAIIVDIPGVLGFALFAAFAVTLINLVVDLLYGVIDPRIRYD